MSLFYLKEERKWIGSPFDQGNKSFSLPVPQQLRTFLFSCGLHVLISLTNSHLYKVVSLIYAKYPHRHCKSIKVGLHLSRILKFIFHVCWLLIPTSMVAFKSRERSAFLVFLGSLWGWAWAKSYVWHSRTNPWQPASTGWLCISQKSGDT